MVGWWTFSRGVVQPPSRSHPSPSLTIINAIVHHQSWHDSTLPSSPTCFSGLALWGVCGIPIQQKCPKCHAGPSNTIRIVVGRAAITSLWFYQNCRIWFNLVSRILLDDLHPYYRCSWLLLCCPPLVSTSCLLHAISTLAPSKEYQRKLGVVYDFVLVTMVVPLTINHPVISMVEPSILTSFNHGPQKSGDFPIICPPVFYSGKAPVFLVGMFPYIFCNCYQGKHQFLLGYTMDLDKTHEWWVAAIPKWSLSIGKPASLGCLDVQLRL